MFHFTTSTLRARLAAIALLLTLGIAFTGLLPATAAAANPTVYTFESSAGRTCTAAVEAERTGGVLVLRRLEFRSDITCESVAGTASPVVGGAYLRLYEANIEPLGVVLTSGERSGEFGYSCETLDSAPCSDEGAFPLSLAGRYYAQNDITITLPEGETWNTVPLGCTLTTPSSALCGLRSETLTVSL